MFEHDVRVSKQMLNLLRALVKEIDDANFLRPVPGARNPPAFILSHLAVTADAGLMRLGREKLCPDSWHQAFRPGSKPEEVPFAYPSKQELTAVVERGYEALQSAALSATPEQVNQPHGVAFLKGSPMESVGDLIVLLLTSHMGIHLGQLSLMRRQLGFPPLF